MCLKRCGRRRKLPILMTIRPANGGNGVKKQASQKEIDGHVARLSGLCEKIVIQLLRRNHFELGVGAVARLLVGPPPPKLRHVTEAPPCMCSYATSTTNSGRSGSHDRSLPWLQRLWPPGIRLCPIIRFASPRLPWMIRESVLPIGRQKFTSSSLLFREARANANVL